MKTSATDWCRCGYQMYLDTVPASLLAIIFCVWKVHAETFAIVQQGNKMRIINKNKITAHLGGSKPANVLKMDNTVNAMMQELMSNEKSKSSSQLEQLEVSSLLHWHCGLFGADVFIYELVFSKHRVDCMW